MWTKKLKMKNSYDKLLEAKAANTENANNNNNSNLNNQNDGITWHWELPLNFTLKAKFDHIFYHNLQCVKYGVKLSGASDHYPIFAHFL